MRKLFMLLLCIVSFKSYAQFPWPHIDFDPGDTFYHSLIIVDTINYPGNTWQVGKPNKSTFTAAFSVPNAIVTDTVQPYPANDTSVFYLKVPARTYCPINSMYNDLIKVEFFYQLDIDSNAIAQIEIAADTGIAMHWVNVKDSLPLFFHWDGLPPELDSSTSGWTQFKLYVASWSGLPYDTVLFRFTFISDSTPASKDGWIMDNFNFWYWCEGSTPQVANENLISIYPNPSAGSIYVHASKQISAKSTVTIYNMLGQEIYKTDKLPPNGHLNLSIPAGVYTLKYLDEDEYCIKRIIIN